MSSPSPTNTRVACPVCGYNQTGNTAPRCPECGAWADEFRHIADERAARWAKIDATLSSIAPVVLSFPIAIQASRAGPEFFEFVFVACALATIANNVRSMHRVSGTIQALTWHPAWFALFWGALVTAFQMFVAIMFVAPALDGLRIFGRTDARGTRGHVGVQARPDVFVDPRLALVG